MTDQKRNYQPELETLLRALQTEAAYYEAHMSDARDLLNRTIEVEDPDEDDRPATPAELGEQDARFVLDHLLRPHAEDSYWDKEAGKAQPTITHQDGVEELIKEARYQQEAIIAYANAYKVVFARVIEPLTLLLKEEADGRS